MRSDSNIAQVKPNVGLRRRRVCKLRQGARTRAYGGKVHGSGVGVSVDPSFLTFSFFFFEDYTEHCHVSFLPMLSCLSPLYMYGLGPCAFSRLVYDLPLRGGWGLSSDGASPNFERLSLSQSWRAVLGGHRAVWCLTYPNGGDPFHRALLSLVGKETWFLGPVRLRTHDACQPTNIVNCCYTLAGRP